MQTHLCTQLQRIDTTVGEGFFYDITSTYMEGSQCVIAKLGYSRDHRPDLEQIVKKKRPDVGLQSKVRILHSNAAKVWES